MSNSLVHFACRHAFHPTSNYYNDPYLITDSQLPIRLPGGAIGAHMQAALPRWCTPCVVLRQIKIHEHSKERTDRSISVSNQPQSKRVRQVLLEIGLRDGRVLGMIFAKANPDSEWFDIGLKDYEGIQDRIAQAWNEIGLLGGIRPGDRDYLPEDQGPSSNSKIVGFWKRFRKEKDTNANTRLYENAVFKGICRQINNEYEAMKLHDIEERDAKLERLLVRGED
ncbi:hypothetical protein B0J14DRAFT_556490 [Halenospora varia]|nr:hypothetical protein B0J14DRAFT_556490 [Halenospora varia]